MKKIMPLAASIILILVAGIFVGVGTRAIFSDTEKVSVRDINAGTLDLKLNDADAVVSLHIDNIAPGWGPKDLYWRLKNTGSLPGIVSIEITPIINKENGQNEPEATVDGTTGALEGELGAKIWVDKVHLLWTWNKVTRLNTGSPSGPQWWNKYLNDLGGNTLYAPAGNDLGILESSEEVDFYLKLSLGSGVGNEIQSDSVEFDIIFHLDQA
jgi:predicted ribosomally synthesized peptide with SipW-like signal peptide